MVDTISFYADNEDLQTAAYIALVFFELITPNQYEAFFSRIIVSYLELLQTLQLYSQAAEVLKYGP